MTIPVLLLNFNRPEHTASAVKILKEIQPKKVYLAQDGPRSGNPADQEKCEKVRNILELEISWKTEKHFLLRKENLGCRNAVSSAIDWFFQHERFGIILEDDCLVTADFFKLCAELDGRFQDDKRIGMIAAFNPGIITEWSYHLSQISLIYGWATWRDRWQAMDVHMKDFPAFLKSQRINDLTPNSLANNYMIKKWQETYEKQNDSWAYAWSFSQFKNKSYCVVPAVNLVRNTGLNIADATNTQVDVRNLDKIEQREMKWPLSHPEVEIDRKKDLLLFYKTHKSKVLLYANYLLPTNIITFFRPLYLWVIKKI